MRSLSLSGHGAVYHSITAQFPAHLSQSGLAVGFSYDLPSDNYWSSLSVYRCHTLPTAITVNVRYAAMVSCWYLVKRTYLSGDTFAAHYAPKHAHKVVVHLKGLFAHHKDAHIDELSADSNENALR